MALLLVHAYRGLMSHSAALKNIESKLVELHWVESQPSSLTADELLDHLKRARTTLEEYKNAARDASDVEKQWVAALEEKFARLDKAIAQAQASRTLDVEDRQYILFSKEVHSTLTDLARTTDYLQSAILECLLPLTWAAKK
jgi:hypothetical protein